MLQDQEGTPNQLPEDVLVNILRRLAPRCLAISRCVCKPWCTIIDTRRLLRSDFLPLSVAGIFINFHDLIFSEFFSRFSITSTIYDYLPIRGNFRDHCNGLLMLSNYVVNPATRQWVQLPPCPSLHLGSKIFFYKEYLVFDPTLSSHFEVFLIPYACAVSSWSNSKAKLNPEIEGLEWPLSPCILHVFSSRTKGWEERSFVREGEAAGTVADMRLDGSYSYHCHNAVYWRGALYVHCQTNFVMRISLLDGKYQVIKPPAGIELTPDPKLYLGRSQKGVYCALDDYYVYILDVSYGKMEWVRKASIGFRHRQTYTRPKPWTLQDINYGEPCDENQDHNDEVIMEQNVEVGFAKNNTVETKEWDSDDDNVIGTEDWDDSNFGGDITFLGFHPYKEVVFLSEGLSRGLAYHLNTSKFQYLGNLSPTNYGSMGIETFIEGSFPYTPWMGKFPEEK